MGAVCLAGQTHAGLGSPDLFGFVAFFTGLNLSRRMDIPWVSPQVDPCVTNYGQDPLCLDERGLGA